MRNMLVCGLVLSTLMSLGSVCFAGIDGENTTESGDMSSDLFYTEFAAEPDDVLVEIANESAEMQSIAKSFLADIESEISTLETEISELEARMANDESLIATTEASLAELKARLAAQKDMKTALETIVASTERIAMIV